MTDGTRIARLAACLRSRFDLLRWSFDANPARLQSHGWSHREPVDLPLATGGFGADDGGFHSYAKH